MSLQIAKNEQESCKAHAMSDAQAQDKSIKVLIPYDGSESAEMALDDLRRAGLLVADAGGSRSTRSIQKRGHSMCWR